MLFFNEEETQKLIDETFEDWGFKEEGVVDFFGYQNKKYTPDTKNVERIENKLNMLIKHLGLEYYKKEIKEINGKCSEYTQEGFRKIKNIKVGKTKKKKK